MITWMESHERSRNNLPLGSSHNAERNCSSYAAASSVVARSPFLYRIPLKWIECLTPFIHMDFSVILLVIVSVSSMDDDCRAVDDDKIFKKQSSGIGFSEISVFQVLFSAYMMFDKTTEVRSTNGDNCAFQLHWQSYESKYSTCCMGLMYCVNIHLNISTSFSRTTSDLHPEERNGPQSLSQAGLENMMNVWKGKLVRRG